MYERAYAMNAVFSGSTSESSSPVSGLQWKKRATVVIGSTHRRRIRESRCGWYRVVHSRCLYGPRKGRQAIPDVFYAMKLVVISRRICWKVISEHRKQGPALRACEKDAKKNRDATQICDHCGERPPTHFEVRTLFENNTQLCRQCWNHLHRDSRSRRVLPGRLRSGTRRRLPLSSDQLSFAFGDETKE
jgi:hypothetical protein